MLPRIGTANHPTAMTVTRSRSAIPIIAKGIVFPAMSSPGVRGLTRSCSRVPISRSRTMASEVSRSATSIMMAPMTAGTL